MRIIMFYMGIKLVSTIQIFLTLLMVEKCKWGRRGVSVMKEKTPSENALNVPEYSE
jgi:hypothetical protein